MKCARCCRPRPLNPWITGTEKGDIAYQCRCGNPRTIPWPDATTQQREQAFLAEESRNATSEMMVGGRP